MHKFYTSSTFHLWSDWQHTTEWHLVVIPLDSSLVLKQLRRNYQYTKKIKESYKFHIHEGKISMKISGGKIIFGLGVSASIVLVIFTLYSILR